MGFRIGTMRDEGCQNITWTLLQHVIRDMPITFTLLIHWYCNVAQ